MKMDMKSSDMGAMQEQPYPVSDAPEVNRMSMPGMKMDAPKASEAGKLAKQDGMKMQQMHKDGNE